MKISILINVVLAIALVLVSLRLAKNANGSTADEASANEDQNPVIENIMTRSSVRAYTNEAVSDSDINILLKAGMAAPTAIDKRPWHFVVVTDSKKLAQIAKSSPNAKMVEKAPLAILVCGDLKKAAPDPVAQAYWIQDCSAATENVLLAAHGLGLGAVWCGVYPVQERVDKIREIFSLPNDLIPLNVIVIGHPSGTPRIKDKWNPADITYVK